MRNCLGAPAGGAPLFDGTLPLQSHARSLRGRPAKANPFSGRIFAWARARSGAVAWELFRGVPGLVAERLHMFLQFSGGCPGCWTTTSTPCSFANAQGRKVTEVFR